jgi:hypothetical protein
MAFELIKNKAFIMKMDVAIISKFAIENARESNNRYLEILWGSAELRNSKKVEEFAAF